MPLMECVLCTMQWQKVLSTFGVYFTYSVQSNEMNDYHLNRRKERVKDTRIPKRIKRK